MHNVAVEAGLAFCLAAHFAANAFAGPVQNDGNVPQSVECPGEAAGTLVLINGDEAEPPKHAVVAPGLKLVDVHRAEGSCVGRIAYFLAGHIFLSSGDRVVERPGGEWKLYPPVSPGEPDPIDVEVEVMPGYELQMAHRVLSWPITSSGGNVYIGAFEGESDWVIARFDVLSGTPSSNAEILIRSPSPIESIYYLPAPDSPDSQIGIVQRVGPHAALLYTYDWYHGQLPPLQ